MLISELTLMVALTAFAGVLALALLIAGKIPAPKPLRFTGVFRVLFVVFLLFILPVSVLRLPHSYSSTCRIEIASRTQPAVPNSQLLRNEMEQVVSVQFLRPIISELYYRDLGCMEWHEGSGTQPSGRMKAGVKQMEAANKRVEAFRRRCPAVSQPPVAQSVTVRA
jgi:hypothetical protein